MRYVYLLQSESAPDQRYIGVTSDLSGGSEGRFRSCLRQEAAIRLEAHPDKTGHPQIKCSPGATRLAPPAVVCCK